MTNSKVGSLSAMVRRNLAVRGVVLAVCMAVGGVGAASANCSIGLPLQSTAIPSLPGRAVYQGTDSGGSTQLYLYDFATSTKSLLSVSGWAVTVPINAQFSPDGQRITFTAVNTGGRRDVYLFKFGATAPVNLTLSMTGATKSEDPKWSSDGKKIVFKQDGNIKIMAISFDGSGNPTVTSVTAITTNGTVGTLTEASAPYLSLDMKYVYFVRGVGATEEIHVITLSSTFSATLETVFSSNSNYGYYPAVRDFTTIFYAGWTSATGRNDQVLVQAPSLSGPNSSQPPLNDCNADNSDPTVVDSDYILFSSDSASVSSGRVYRPLLGSLANAQVWDLSATLGASLPGAVLGMSYTAAR